MQRKLIEALGFGLLEQKAALGDYLLCVSGVMGENKAPLWKETEAAGVQGDMQRIPGGA